jgi:hypothetical protein
LEKFGNPRNFFGISLEKFGNPGEKLGAAAIGRSTP